MIASFALAFTIALGGSPRPAQSPTDCPQWQRATAHRNPTAPELRCRYHVRGPGRFGLLSYVDVPVYQPATPMPGTHVVGVPGMPHPATGESYERWEWRVLHAEYGPEALRVHRELELLAPQVAGRVLKLEQSLARAGIHAIRRETWRSPERQVYLFQQGRSRPGPLSTATLTSWHSYVDALGQPAGRAVDYDVPARQMERFHQLVHEAGLQSYGPDSFDPGHVFLPDPDAIPAREVVLLRVIPRVPNVTLSTGLPTDRPLPPGGRDALRTEMQIFLLTPAQGPPRPRVDLGVLRTKLVRTPAAVHPPSKRHRSRRRAR